MIPECVPDADASVVAGGPVRAVALPGLMRMTMGFGQDN
jgi:hypothetical protein